MRVPDAITIDFETMPIMQRPDHPPEPVGVAIKYGSEKSRYYAWGHAAGGNNCTRDDGVAAVDQAYACAVHRRATLLFHNAKFDLSVAEERLGIPQLPWTLTHDTMFLAYLADPHAKSNGLKELAEDILEWPPEERDAVAEWVLDRKKALVAEWPEYRKVNKKTGRPVDNIAPSETGKWIFAAPGDLVGRYACGDVDRTYALFHELYPLIVRNGMLEAYNRERQVLPILMENERRGMRVDVSELRNDVVRFSNYRSRADKWLRERLEAPHLNLDSDDEFAEALSAAGIVDDDQWTFTKTGKRSVSKVNLRPEMYNDEEVANAFGYRNRLGTCLKMFMEPWFEQALARDGVISTNWNQTRGSEDKGTRTGRPSTSKPNFLNISKDFEDRTDGYQHPHHLDVKPLPLVRKYILPDEDHVFLHRDFDGQELRIFAHFEQGELFREYLRDPHIDVHQFVSDRVLDLTGAAFERTIVKNINFGKIYGAGIPRIMEIMRCSDAEAKEFDAVHKKALPGVGILNDEIKRLVRAGSPIVTWGGRIYFVEEPRRIDGRLRTFEYKLLNYLVQGSAADVTKEALIRWHNHPDRHPTDRFLVTVYDEINISAHRERAVEAMRVLRECMEGIELDVPLLSSPKAGTSWGDCIKPAKGESEDAFLRRVIKEAA